MIRFNYSKKHTEYDNNSTVTMGITDTNAQCFILLVIYFLIAISYFNIALISGQMRMKSVFKTLRSLPLC